jgi:hypothetical protein
MPQCYAVRHKPTTEFQGWFFVDSLEQLFRCADDLFPIDEMEYAVLPAPFTIYTEASIGSGVKPLQWEDLSDEECEAIGDGDLLPLDIFQHYDFETARCLNRWHTLNWRDMQASAT